MTGHPRARRSGLAALVAILALALAACDSHMPNSMFGAHSQFGHDVDHLTMGLVYAGAGVFVFVEAALIFAIFKFRYRPGNTKAVQTHGNTKLEIAWTFIPAVILAFIAVPTVRMIFLTQSEAPAGSLEVEVIGHQWWWEFRYPEYKIVTANELYLPVGRPVTFSLRTNNVLHSFWIPQLNGKRDLISNHTNHIWFTPDSIGAYNGFCAEFCGTSHANMRFKAFVVGKEQFADLGGARADGTELPGAGGHHHAAQEREGRARGRRGARAHPRDAHHRHVAQGPTSGVDRPRDAHAA